MILYDQWAKFGLWTSLLWLVNIPYILDCQKNTTAGFAGEVFLFFAMKSLGLVDFYRIFFIGETSRNVNIRNILILSPQTLEHWPGCNDPVTVPPPPPSESGVLSMRHSLLER